MSPKLDIAIQDTMDAIKILEEGGAEEKVSIINEIKVQMVDILNHFIDCTWGAHYMTLFNKMIIPYLDDPKVLQFVLNGPIIDDSKGNVFRGKSGTKMYKELYFYLMRVEAERIRDFLFIEFNRT
ncbi:MAG: hypothetical protein K8F54_11760 [Altibacter sp.]|uniref:hypothetical protein n=1 Tax=Altibacter sp. TaxID=2024823 RepID=UPI001DD3992F|nr:hypothetical protein [Altibacter sp.]MBZ0328275.1 hypothetical protein [Altibacter sp.]